MQEESAREERISHVSGKLKCSPPSVQFKSCKDNNAMYVCHECGAPLCAECMTEITDRELYRFRSAGKRILVGVATLILLPLLTVLLSKYIGVSVVGGVFSALIILAALWSPIELLRKEELDQSGELQSRSRLVVREYTKAIHCKQCSKEHTTSSKVEMGVVAAGAVFLTLGLFGIIRGLTTSGNFDGFLVLVSLGIGLFYAKGIVSDLATYYVPKLLKL